MLRGKKEENLKSKFTETSVESQASCLSYGKIFTLSDLSRESMDNLIQERRRPKMNAVCQLHWWLIWILQFLSSISIYLDDRRKAMFNDYCFQKTAWERELFARISVVWVPLTFANRQVCSTWCRNHTDCNTEQWATVL